MLIEPIQIDYERLYPIYEKALNNGRVIDLTDIPKEDWLQLRQIIGIGASDISVILGLNRYKTAFQLWKEKVSDEIEPIDNKFTRWGNLLEPSIIEEYERMTLRKTSKDTFMRIHPEHAFLYANLDGIYYEGERIVGAVECKSTVSSVYRSWESNPDDCPQGIPLEHYCQVMHQFACVPELKWIDIAVLILDQREVEIKRITPDWEYIGKQTDAVVKWYNTYVPTMIAPPMTAFEYEYASPHLGSFVEASETIADKVNKLKEKKDDYKNLESDIKDLEIEIKEHIGENETLTFGGEVLATWKQQKREGVDGPLLKKMEPETFERFKKVSEFRVLRLK